MTRCHPVLASSINGPNSSSQRKWSCQTYVEPILRWQPAVSDHKTLICSWSYWFALTKKTMASNVHSAIFGNYDFTQSATPIPFTQKAEQIRQEAEPIQ